MALGLGKQAPDQVLLPIGENSALARYHHTMHEAEDSILVHAIFFVPPSRARVFDLKQTCRMFFSMRSSLVLLASPHGSPAVASGKHPCISGLR